MNASTMIKTVILKACKLFFVLACVGLISVFGSVDLASAAIKDSGFNNQAVGAAKQLEGQAQKDMNKLNSVPMKASANVKGDAKIAKGRAQQDLGNTQSAVAKLGDKIQDAAETVVDNVKDIVQPKG